MSSTPKFRRESSGASDLRTPPHSIEAEQAVLGGLMLDRTAWDNVGDVVTADDFFRPDHKLIFESIASLAGEAQPCDPVTVSEHLQRLGKLQEVGGLAYLGTLTRDTPGRRQCARLRGDRQGARAAALAGDRRRRDRELGVERRRRDRRASWWRRPSGAFSRLPRAVRAARDTSARARRCRR